MRLFGRLQQVREQRTQLRVLVRRARLFTPDVADKVATLARSNPDGALEVFVSAFQREHFELDEAVCDQGFDVWADVTAESLPLLMRGTDRCNGIDPLGSRPGYALQWALIQNVFDGDERAQVIAEVAETFGEELAGRLEAADPPPHEVLCQRLARSRYVGMLAFSSWALGDVRNPLLFLHSHHADELVLPWTRRGVARAARLIHDADDFQAPMLALARWLEHAPAEHGPLLVDAVMGRRDADDWSRSAIRPCRACGFPPAVHRWQEAASQHLLGNPALHPGASALARTTPHAYPQEDPEEYDDW
ncbi:MAG: hypothetical protein M3069_16635 [Chloroflexota bacterium]|nr:hypothetical protein [Chloroflexota bacterium]